MRVSSVKVAFAAYLWMAALTHAHGEMMSIVPTDGAIYASSPPYIEIKFDEPAQVTRVQIATADYAEIDESAAPINIEVNDEIKAKLEGLEVQPVGENLPLLGMEPFEFALPDRTSFKQQFTFAIDALPTGKYELIVRSVDKDEQVTKQVITFAVQ